MNRRAFLAAIAAAPVAQKLLANPVSPAPDPVPIVVSTWRYRTEQVSSSCAVPASAMEALEPYIRAAALAHAREIEQDLLEFYDRLYPRPISRGDVYTFRRPSARQP